MTKPSAAPTSNSALCPGCGEPNRCAIAAGRAAAECWCMAEPRGLPFSNADRCWCPRCLQAQSIAAGRPAH